MSLDPITLKAAKDYTDEKIEQAKLEGEKIIIDPTLSQTGAVAEAKATGERIKSIEDYLSKFYLVNAKDYGAKGDGVTDDTAAIKLALDSVHENGILYFPLGTYMVDNIMLKNDMVVKGDGRGSIIKLNDNAPLTKVEENDAYWNNCFTIYQISNVKIEDIALDGNRTKNSAPAPSTDHRLNGIFIQESTDIILNRIYSYNNRYHGCFMNDDIYRVEISDSEIYDNGFQPFCGNRTIIDCKFINNYCRNNGLQVNGDAAGADGIIFFDNCKNLLISGNIIEFNSNVAIDIGGSIFNGEIEPDEYRGTSNIIVSNNIIKRNNLSEKIVSGIQFTPVYCDEIIIEGNTIENCYYGIYGKPSEFNFLGSCINICDNIFKTKNGIYIPIAASLLNIQGNQFLDYSESGIVLINSVNSSITSNIFKPNDRIGGENCVKLNGCTRTIISSNQLFNSEYGIVEENSDLTLITNNNFQSINFEAYKLVGSNSKAINNISKEGTIEDGLSETVKAVLDALSEWQEGTY